MPIPKIVARPDQTIGSRSGSSQNRSQLEGGSESIDSRDYAVNCQRIARGEIKEVIGPEPDNLWRASVRRIEVTKIASGAVGLGNTQMRPVPRCPIELISLAVARKRYI